MANVKDKRIIELMSMKKSFLTITLLLLCTSSLASKSIEEIAQNIPYQFGDKRPQVLNAEKALDKHPMLSSALKGVVESTKYCFLFQFDSKKRSKDELLSTQFNGGELEVTFTYFCYNQTKQEVEAQPEVIADVVLSIKGDYSDANKEIIDPSISYSNCYSHFCGSN